MTNTKRIYKSQDNVVLGGVCGGIGEYLNLDPVIVRIVFVILFFTGVGSIFFAYLILWLIIPDKPDNSKAVEKESKK